MRMHNVDGVSLDTVGHSIDVKIVELDVVVHKRI